MYNQRLWENQRKIKHKLQRLGELGLSKDYQEFFKYEIPVKKLLRELNGLLDRHRMLLNKIKK